MTANGLTKRDEQQLTAVLARLNACNRRAFLGGTERYALDMAIVGIKQRLEPQPVHALLSQADKVCEPLEHLLRDIDAQTAVAECVG
jgi:hypothetical protein